MTVEDQTEHTHYCGRCKEFFPLTKWQWRYIRSRNAWMHIKCGEVEKVEQRDKSGDSDVTSESSD